MQIRYHEKGLEDLQKLEKDVQLEFRNIFKAVHLGEVLPRSAIKKISGTELIEFRIKFNKNIFRALEAEVQTNIIILLLFQKKTNKTPIRLIDTAKKRLLSLR